MAKEMMLSLGVSVAAAGALTALSKLSKSTEKFSETYKKLDSNLQKLKAEEQKIKNLENLKKSYVSVSKEWLQAVTKLRKLKDAYEKSGKSNIELAKKIKEQERVLQALNTKKERQKHLFKEARSEIEKEYGTLKKYKEQVEKTSKSLEVQNKLKKINADYENKKASINSTASDVYEKNKKIAAVTGTMLAVPLKIYMDVEESQADLRKMLGDEAEKYYDKLAQISNNSALSQPEIYEISGALAQSGIKGDEIVEYTDKAQKLKVAFDMSTEAAGEFLAKTKEQLGLSKQEVFAFADSINYMADNTASSASQLVEFSQRIGGVAKTIGLTKEANVALGATLISMGKAPEIAATGIKQMYLELSKGADTKKKASAFSFIGVDASKLAADMSKDAEGTIVKVLEKINKLNQADKASVLNDLFGEQAIDSVATLANNTDKLKENLEKVKSEMSNGAVEREYQNRMQTLSNQLKLVKNQFMNTLAELGEALAPIVKDILEALMPIVKNIANFVRENPKITKMVMSFTALSLVFGAVGFKMFALFNKFKKFKAALTLSKVFGSIIKFGSVFFGIFSKIIGYIKMIGVAIKTAFLTNPIGLIIVAIVGVITILVVLYKKNEKFRNFVNNMWKSISNWAVSAWNTISTKAIEVYNGLKNGWNVFVSFFKKLIDGIVNFYSNSWTRIKNIAVNVFRMISTVISTYIGVYKGIFNLFVAFFTGKWGGIPKIVSGIWKNIKNGMSGFVDAAKNILKGLFGWFGDQWNNIKNTASGILGVFTVKKKIGKNYAGTNYWSGGLTTVAERGMELIKIPGQQPFLAQSQMLLNLPKGTQILNNSATMKILNKKESHNEKHLSNYSNRLKKVDEKHYSPYKAKFSNNLFTTKELNNNENHTEKHIFNYLNTIKNNNGNREFYNENHLLNYSNSVKNIERKHYNSHSMYNSQALNSPNVIKNIIEKKESLGKKLKNGIGLRERIISLKDRIQNSNSVNKSVSNDNITININANSGQNELEIARLVRFEIEKIKNKQLRTAF